MSKVFDFITKNIVSPTMPAINVGDVVKVYQKIVEGKKERVQIFEGLVIAKHNKKIVQTTITVRKIASGVGVERIFPLISNKIEKIEVVKSSKVRRAKLYYMRGLVGRAARLKDEVETNVAA
ncbi:MAG: 50S ribosomal protein L19 [Candidatus Abawacabacteria bacterium]|nr:50S ribosomal protein L19 [Candidatus Abawacabacteria bacterium]